MSSKLTPQYSIEAGFSLIEALVSLMLLTLALLPTLLVASRSLDVAAAIRGDVTAANLAQEGVEVVRAIRDTNWIAGNSFNTGLNDGTYQVEWNSTTLAAYADLPLKINNNGIYNYVSGVDSIFKRKIIITNVSGVQVQVISEIDWTERGGVARSIQLEDHLYDWR